ncbi:hypothetical protein H8356DRAFT_1683618 [Neocallimastix lanati (nom. inval.)]|jgi:hypothetical protein|uniref:ER membrane protein complex subunit 7 beta-sandwich domain-containing protein n=1 Tax=Neocallimastix californiae TaxID=1754190 RepID=A0A1Y2BYA2_9FUNG|nr:hypothetical protein H8356DRAFT_1683618 [Neocallimastix sp. JGI-2020a]ORY39716.1 hypothetical protein LY90DRAFT_672397 [Neocallimastix californiae]|eukprot:ORY39716.1 hypothetical protein LY90DRAFT_672397 [Neocallimastix californiae]
MKTIISSVLLILIFNIISCYSASIIGRIYPNQLLTDVNELTSDTEVILNSGEYITYIKADHTFEVKNVKPGTYLLQINTKNFVFDRYWIIVSDANSIVAAKEASEIEFNIGFIKENRCNYPLEVQAIQRKDYFEPRSYLNILSFLKNPIVLLMVFSCGMMFLMPRLVSGLDEEELKEMKKSQGSMQDFMNKAQNGDLSQMFSSFLADAQMASQTKSKRK